MSRETAWVIGDRDGKCEHGSGALRHVGDDGINAFFQCGRCEAVLVARIDEILAVSRVR